jgi:uncharacterized protein involved in exopolysaccharide biosynthesis
MKTLQQFFQEHNIQLPQTAETISLTPPPGFVPLKQSKPHPVFFLGDIFPTGTAPHVKPMLRTLKDVKPLEAMTQWLPNQGILGILKHERRLIAAITAAAVLWGGIYCATGYKPHYQSQATVIIKDSAITGSYLLNGQSLPVQTTSSNASNPVLNMIGLLSSSSVKDALWQYFRTEHPEALKKLRIENQEDWDAFYGDGKGIVKAKNTPGTDLISIQFTWMDAAVARDGLDVLLKAFQDESLSLNQAEQRSRSSYLDKQLAELSDELKQIRKQKSAYKSTQKTVNVQRESDDLTRTRIETETQLNQIISRAKGKEAEVARLEKLLKMSAQQAVDAAAFGMNPTMSDLQKQLNTLTRQAAMLKTTLTDKNPKVMEVEAQITEVAEQIEAERKRTNTSGDRSVTDVTRSQLTAQMASAQAESLSLWSQAQTLQERLNQVNTTMSSFPTIEEGITNLEQEERTLSQALDNLRQRALEAHLKQAETLSNVFIIDKPSLPLKPKFPTPLHLMVLSLLAGLALGCGAALFKHRMQRKPAGLKAQTQESNVLLLDALQRGTRG